LGAVFFGEVGRGYQLISATVAPTPPQPRAAQLVTLPTVAHNKQSPEALPHQTRKPPAAIQAPARFHAAKVACVDEFLAPAITDAQPQAPALVAARSAEHK